jgi:transcriptional regulator with XRE-family HTH domain
MDTYSFGEWLQQRRNQLRLTQKEVGAAALCSAAMIRKIEADERQPSTELAYLLADALRIPPEQRGLFVEVARGERPVAVLQDSRGARVQGSGGAKGLKRGESEAIIVHNNLPPQPTPFMGQELAELAALKSEGNDHLITIAAPSQRGAVFSLLDHIIRGQLIGREDELSQLEGFWNRAERGEGHLVLLSGEPGIGKTRMVEELSALAQLRGALVLEGHFHPELGVTYLGFREALQDYLRSIPSDQARAVIGTSAPELVKLVPEVESIIPNITPNLPMGELEAERLRLFDHVTQFLIRLTKKTPMLFVLEDLHWADGPSLMFLHFLLRNTRQVPMLVLGTYRETELDPVRPFYETLLGMNRDRLYTRVA